MIRSQILYPAELRARNMETVYIRAFTQKQGICVFRNFKEFWSILGTSCTQKAPTYFIKNFPCKESCREIYNVKAEFYTDDQYTKEFLLKLVKDRKRRIDWMFQAKGRSILKTENPSSFQLSEAQEPYGSHDREAINNKFPWNI